MVMCCFSVFYIIDAAPNLPKNVEPANEEGKYQMKKGGQMVTGTKKEIRLSFQVSNDTENINCVCFTKLAKALLKEKGESFIFLEQQEQREVLKELLYERKLLKILNQGENFLLIEVEKVSAVQDDE